MADILSDLEGILGAEATAKLRGNATLADRLTRGESIREFYDGNMDGDPPPPRTRTQDPPPPARAATGTTDESLAQIMSRLDSIGDVDKKVADTVNSVVEKRGGELVG